MEKCRPSLEKVFYGVATVGDRGQIVIPADARKQRGIETGDKLLFMASPTGRGLWMGKIDDVREFMTHALENIDHLAEQDVEPHMEEPTAQ
jgi:AbrB family looped-hinge helix DNA binding protein